MSTGRRHRVRAAASRLAGALACLALFIGLPGARGAAPSVARGDAALARGGMRAAAPVALHPANVRLDWLRVDPQHPRTLYLGLSFGEAGSTCMMRSSDGGTTWADLAAALLDAEGPCPSLTTGLAPVVLSSNGARVYTEVLYAYESAPILWSHGGLTWTLTADASFDRAVPAGLATSPLLPQRVYALRTSQDAPDQGSACHSALYASDDGGHTWQDVGDPTGIYQDPGAYHAFTPVPDPVQPQTVYANIGTCGDDTAVHAARSSDGGRTWVPLTPPDRAVHSFGVGTDPHMPGGIVAQAGDPSIPTDRRYLSSDQGRTWTVATCPGARRGSCPAFTVDNVFGAGQSYAFFADGIYPFRGRGPVGPRLALSDRLPLYGRALWDVEAGQRYGDPIYLFGAGTQARVQGVIYRSSDAGHSWRLLPAGVLPNVAAPSRAPGALYVPHAHHSVAAAFVATYRHMSPLLLGDPVTEAYWEGDTLTQDFVHLRLQMRGGRVVVGDLDAFTQQRAAGFAGVRPVPNTPTRLYFPQTQHTLQGDLLRFWQMHGGLAVFGAPTSEVFRGHNGDGSGRVYAMQWFQKARLERHPETHDPRYAILLGLVGVEALADRGWLTACQPSAPGMDPCET